MVHDDRPDGWWFKAKPQLSFQLTKRKLLTQCNSSRKNPEVTLRREEELVYCSIDIVSLCPKIFLRVLGRKCKHVYADK